MKVQTLSKPTGQKGIQEIWGLKILELPSLNRQKIRKDWIERFRRFVTQTDDSITIHTVDGDVVFNIDHAPGRYCLTCDKKLPDSRSDPFSKECHKHVATHDEPVTNERWPHGYMVANTFECSIDDQRGN